MAKFYISHWAAASPPFSFFQRRREGAHLLVEPLEDVLLGDDLEPVAVHFLSQVSVLALLQLDEGRHLRPEGLLAQTGQTLPEADQELLDLGLHQLRAARTSGARGRKRRDFTQGSGRRRQGARGVLGRPVC